MREYGITTSKADYWIHACPLDATFYVYRRERMLKQLHRFQHVVGETFKGYIVPILSNLRENGGIIRAYYFGYDLKREWEWDWKGATDAQIGEVGEQCFYKFCRQGEFALPVYIKPYVEKEQQYKGKDFKAWLPETETNIEIKTEVRGGLWGTGNIFVQTHEKQHQRITP